MRCKLKAFLPGFVLGLMVLSLASCIKVDTGAHAPTVGAELIDLSKAKSLGELSEAEFAELRKKVLASF